MKLFVLVSENGFYRRRNRWTADPQKATLWTSKVGAAAAMGHCYPRPVDPEIIDFEIDLPDAMKI